MVVVLVGGGRMMIDSFLIVGCEFASLFLGGGYHLRWVGLGWVMGWSFWARGLGIRGTCLPCYAH